MQAVLLSHCHPILFKTLAYLQPKQTITCDISKFNHPRNDTVNVYCSYTACDKANWVTAYIANLRHVLHQTLRFPNDRILRPLVGTSENVCLFKSRIVRTLKDHVTVTHLRKMKARTQGNHVM